MLVTTTLTALTALVLATPLLVTVGHRWRIASTALSSAAAIASAVVAGEVAGRVLDLPSRQVVVGEGVLVFASLVIVRARPLWNPIGHLFFTALMVGSVSYVGLAAKATFAGGLSAVAVVASLLLLLLEIFAVTISATFAFESIDVACRARWRRTAPRSDDAYRPFVSLHVPAYNEPPEMLIDTIQSLEAIDYPFFEIVVIDNNTDDEAVWRPVEAYCEDRPRVRFVHVNPWPGFKSGALNHVLAEHTDPAAQVVGVIDADYLVNPGYLSALVGYFADPALAFVQTPQDYREYAGDTYLTACYDAYKYFFETAMPSRNDRNSIIFGGTMGLIRRSVLEELGGWDEWCITEDAESSLRMLRAGHQGLYVNQSFGQGIMPLTFTSLKKQRFRWCFGGVQILRKHWRSLMPWDRHPSNRLSIVQRLDYLFGGLQWFGDLAGLAFTFLLVASAALLLVTGGIALRALTGVLLLLPVALISIGLLRAMWALRVLTRISARRAALAFATWLSLSWTTALACLRGLARRDGVFLRTPKWKSGGHLVEALRETRTETTLAAGLIALGVAVVAVGNRWMLGGLAGWQALVFACSPYMAWLNQRTELSARLARRARSEDRRDRVAAVAPGILRTMAVSALAAAAVAVFVIGGADRSPQQADVFDKPEREAGDQGPLGNLGVVPTDDPAPEVPATTTSIAPTPSTVAPGTDSPTTVTSSTTATTTTTTTTSPSNTAPTAPTSTSPPASSTPPSSGPPTSSTPPSSGPPTSRGRP